ncbi:MAG: 30S ribosomal protein S4 [Bryobacterales bacterium]|nr:30S ribosomal protein S4 [Bryobacterales bacterium]
MARYIGPVCRLCRREGTKLFLKGERCYTEKCAIEKRNFIPGQHGQARKQKIVGYGLQLREKQKTRRVYGMLETQFRNTFEKAAKMDGITGHNLLFLLERRLDNVVFRMGFGTSRPQSRQIVRHGHIQVNGRKVNIPSFVVKPGDVVEVREKSRNNAAILAARDTTAHQPSPNWLEVDREALKAKVLGHPKREDLVQIQINDQMIVELYSK